MRPILTGILPLLLGSLSITACDSDKGKQPDAKAKTDTPDIKADAKTAPVEAKIDTPKPEPVPEPPKDDPAVPGAAGEAVDGGSGAAKPAGAEGAADAAEPAPAEKPKEGAEPSAGAAKSDGASKTKKPAASKPKPPKVDAKGVYLKKCKSCHGVKGKADTKLGEKHKIADWTQPGWTAKWSRSKIENIVKNGKSGTKMKAFKDKLSPDEIAAVSKYSRSLGR